MLYICEWMAPSRAFYEGRDSHQGTHPSDNFGLGTKSKPCILSIVTTQSWVGEIMAKVSIRCCECVE